jgi:hypothetical protein
MTRRHVLSIAAGLALAFDLTVGKSLTSLRARDIEILGDPRPSRSEKIDLGRRFGTVPCVSKQPGKTILDALLPDYPTRRESSSTNSTVASGGTSTP